MPSFFNRFKRITSSTSYLPEIDGLRFLAIFSVVVILHISHYIDEKFYGNKLIGSAYWSNFVLEGGNGVALFFIISGFILSLPFARWRLLGADPVPLKRYYLRRLTRLEPPYLLALVLLFAASVWLLDKYEFSALLPHFLASAVYVHQPVYHSFSPILPVAWSLEVEVQFYVTAPLLCTLFLIRSAVLRRSILLAFIGAAAVYWFDVWNVVHLLVYIHYFLMGLLLADLHCSGRVLFKNRNLGLAAGLLALAGYLFIPSIGYWPGYALKLVCLFVLFHAVLTNERLKKMFSVPGLILIGGMCYSIYLLHYAIVSAVGYALMGTGVNVQEKALIPFFFLGFVVLVLLGSGLYFLWVEKPFMRVGRHKNKSDGSQGAWSRQEGQGEKP